MKAIWNKQLIAESEDTVEVEGNHYFPANSVKDEFLQPSTTRSTCPWKGKAKYYSLQVDGEENPDAAWHYPEPKAEASAIRDRIAFSKGVRITD